MSYDFRKFNDSYYETVRTFLIELCQNDLTHINWNWARWEWMYHHPDFDREAIDKIGLWFADEVLVGAAIYDHYFGESFFAVKAGHEELESDILNYMVENLSDENGLGIAVNDNDIRTAELLTKYGFTIHEQTENILELEIDKFDFVTSTDKRLSLKNLDTEKDLCKHHEMLWKGFDHQGGLPLDEETLDKQRIMLSAPHINAKTHIAAVNESSEFVSYCGLWYDADTDYAYVEPVCTAPDYRGKGIAKLVISEALKNAHALGAKKAYVISDIEFYKRLGFKQHSHYTFYWYKK